MIWPCRYVWHVYDASVIYNKTCVSLKHTKFHQVIKSKYHEQASNNNVNYLETNDMESSTQYTQQTLTFILNPTVCPYVQSFLSITDEEILVLIHNTSKILRYNARFENLTCTSLLPVKRSIKIMNVNTFYYRSEQKAILKNKMYISIIKMYWKLHNVYVKWFPSYLNLTTFLDICSE
jgi:hypothetical protein